MNLVQVCQEISIGLSSVIELEPILMMVEPKGILDFACNTALALRRIWRQRQNITADQLLKETWMEHFITLFVFIMESASTLTSRWPLSIIQLPRVVHL
jgi:hypothetical protein